MPNITITLDDAAVQRELAALAQKAQSLQPAMAVIGERLVERAKRRFETGTDPTGKPWQANSLVTLGIFAGSFGKSLRKKSGALNKAGAQKLGAKKVLVRDGNLMRQIIYSASANSTTMSATMAYARIHHYGGMAGRNKKVQLPARPFMPIDPQGQLYPLEQLAVLQALRDYFGVDG